MDKSHGRGWCQHDALKLTQIREVDTNQLHGRPVLAVPRHVCSDQCRKTIAGLERKGHSACEGVIVAEVSAIGSVDIAILGHRGHRGAHGDGIADRYLYRAAQMQQAIGSRRCSHAALQFTTDLGFACCNGDSTPNGVATKQGALRSAEHFKALYIDNVEDRADGSGNVDAINIEADTGLGRGQEFFLAHTAEIDCRRVGGAAKARIVVQRQAGNKTLDLIEAIDAAVVEGLAGKCRYRDRRVLEAFLNTACAHHNLFHEARGGGAGLLRDGVRATQCGGQGKGNSRFECIGCHSEFLF